MIQAPIAEGVLAALQERRPISERTLLLVAHPDDEVLGASLLIRHAATLTIAHLTDGASPKLANCDALSVTRRGELDAALQILGSPASRLSFGAPDGSAVSNMLSVIEKLTADLDSVDLVVSHAFEGGHPDHDACAIAVHSAIARRRQSGLTPPTHLEFPLYARGGAGIRMLAFLPDEPQGVRFALSDNEQGLKARALSAFESQHDVVCRFSLQTEALREAVRIDARAPRDPATLLWAREGAANAEIEWRTEVAKALGAVGL